MALTDLVDTGKEILVVIHKALNDCKIDFVEECDKVQEQLHKYTNGRKIIPTFEGDYGMTFGGYGGENNLVFSHPPFYDYFAFRGLISEDEFINAHAKGKARSFIETLENLERCKDRGYDFGLFLESKMHGTDVEVNCDVMSLLKQSGFKRTFFGSYYLSNLAEVNEANRLAGTNFPTAQILPMRLGLFNNEIWQNGYKPADFITVARTTDLSRDYSKPIVVNAVGNKEVVEELSKNPNILGVGWKKKYETLFGVAWDYTLGHFF